MSTRMSSAPSIARVRTAVRTSLSLTFGLGSRKPATNERREIYTFDFTVSGLRLPAVTGYIKLRGLR
jgi:hypothetical protein